MGWLFALLGIAFVGVAASRETAKNGVVPDGSPAPTPSPYPFPVPPAPAPAPQPGGATPWDWQQPPEIAKGETLLSKCTAALRALSVDQQTAQTIHAVMTQGTDTKAMRDFSRYLRTQAANLNAPASQRAALYTIADCIDERARALDAAGGSIGAGGGGP